ncbi:uncharacterized protein PgNI_01750 [Pyricularia grisea]|uniref:polynucleotide adenylyltransferase n=1 Tax=Pyricularia grisea TaxID=148305 RepID=A0A6P8BLG5_PYRGI|nr:uncharacterized protein PgNI_01750 [Pyricularia grisea]TLD17534.1 hypothetical protein PgNI_01750 [Pyricularia grisea]
MEGPQPQAPVASHAIPATSHDTALCIVPPRQLWPTIDRLRSLYDDAFGKWPPHINLVYPFVQVAILDHAVGAIASELEARLQTQHYDECNPAVRLDSSGVFPHRKHNTIYRRDGNETRVERLRALRKAVSSALGHQSQSDQNYRPHLTVAQSTDAKDTQHKSRLGKVDLLPTLEWQVDTLHVLVRVHGVQGTVMKSWGTIDLRTGSLSRSDHLMGFYEDSMFVTQPEDAAYKTTYPRNEVMSCHTFDEYTKRWTPSKTLSSRKLMQKRLRVASYNVLAEFDFPPSQERYPILVNTILSQDALADVLVLQEVTDNFLGYLLANEDIHASYRYVSHAPPNQDDIEPLPSHLNIVVLSRVVFDWEWVQFPRDHKGSVVARFRDLGRWEDGKPVPLVIASVHLTHGLSDQAVLTRTAEIERLLNHLVQNYQGHPWIVAGDFNTTTSSLTIKEALKGGNISQHSVKEISRFDSLLEQEDLVDTWGSHSANTSINEISADSLCPGEDGATYDPLNNMLAFKISDTGPGGRPQRYDKIMLRGEGTLESAGFNRFGFPAGHAATNETSYGSDHWGVRAVLQLSDEATEAATISTGVSPLVVPVELSRASGPMRDPQLLKDILESKGAIPAPEEGPRRQAAFDALRQIVTGNLVEGVSDASEYDRLRSSLIMVPVGSWGLGVSTSSSDIDCLCIGPLSSSTFFALTTQRIKKASVESAIELKLLRRVRANSGVMLELEVMGVRADLQYCAATAVAEQWPAVLKLPANDPTFALPAQTLGKLKALRDLDYLRDSIPDLTKFRVAHRAIKTWAQSRGIYSAKFGYLGGIQVSILLARVCKLLARDHGQEVSVPDILYSFFSHYASFDWRNKIAFDPFFHTKLNYLRSSREPLAILGFFPPALNTTLAATVPSMKAIALEFSRAHELLREDGMTWDTFFRGSSARGDKGQRLARGAADFLHSCKSFVKIELQYWGISLSKGSQFVGWLESRCPLLLVDMSRRLPQLTFRIWPQRFVEHVDAEEAETSRDEENQGETQEYQGFYLIGLEEDSGATDEDRKLAAGTMQTILQRFKDMIRNDEKYFDAKSQWLSTSVVQGPDLGELTLDERSWGNYTAGDEDEDEDEEEEDSASDSQESGQRPQKQKKGKKGKGAREQGRVVPVAKSGAKFRTAADVISRLRWDPALDSSDYVVGYEDRFKGAMEKALDAWKGEQTDEEFIPQHRILYFKRKNDGVVVWERRTRTDLLFGSG